MSTKSSHILKQTCSWKLKVCWSICAKNHVCNLYVTIYIYIYIYIYYTYTHIYIYIYITYISHVFHIFIHIYIPTCIMLLCNVYIFPPMTMSLYCLLSSFFVFYFQSPFPFSPPALFLLPCIFGWMCDFATSNVLFYFILLILLMDLHFLSLGTLLAGLPCYVSARKRHQIYCTF